MRGLKVLLLMFMIVALIVATGCAKRQEVKKTNQPDTTDSRAEVDEDGTMKYVVKAGDTLWGISSFGRIYEDPFQWPLVYKANRDMIEDPDLIYPDQEFEIKKDYSSSDVSDAISKAKDTPQHSPHTSPRKKLPLRY